MAGAIITVIIVAALLVIASGVWVAVGLVRTLVALRSEPRVVHDRTDRDPARSRCESDSVS